MGAVNGQSMFRIVQSAVKVHSETANLAGLRMTSKVKGQKLAYSTVKMLKTAGQGFDRRSQL